MTALLDIVIVHFGEPSLTYAAVERLTPCAGWATVTVVDNSANAAAGIGPPARAVDPSRNLGFGAGANLGARCGAADWLLVLNPDLELSPIGIRALLDRASGEPRLGALAPRLVHANGAPQINGGSYSGWVRELVRCSGVGSRLRPLRARLRRDRRDRAPNGSLVARDWVSGAGLLLRRSAFEAAGGFDERFFLYYEDEDLCRRLAALGWHAAVDPTVVARHAVGGSHGNGDPYRTPNFERSRALYHRLHSGPALGRLVAWHVRRSSWPADAGARV